MKIILVMSFSGSLMFLGYLLVKWISGNRLSDNVLYFLFKASVLYYLIPLLFLKPTYKQVGNFLSEKIFGNSDRTGVWYIDSKESILFKLNGTYIVNDTLQGEVQLVTLWIGVGILIVGVQIAKYYIGKTQRANVIWKSPSDHDKELVQKWMTRYKLRQKVKLFPAGEQIATFTQGCFHPAIFYSSPDEGELEREMRLQHELVHIKNRDWLWNILVNMVLFLHWYNPLVWLLVKEWHVVSEDACDSEVLKGRVAEERAKYARMLIAESMMEKENKKPALNVPLAGNVKGKRNIERRVNKIMNRKSEVKGMKKVFALFAVCMLVALNSLTVFAYEDVGYEKIVIEAENEIEKNDLNCDWVFVEYGNEDEVTGYFADIKAEWDVELALEQDVEWYFIDTEGNVYPVNVETDTCAFCTNHALVLGEIMHHNKLDDGSCIVKRYEGARCINCAYTEWGALIGTATFNPCTHEDLN